MKRNYSSWTVVALFTLSGFVNSIAGDIEDGKTKSAACAACHGKDGISSNPQWPNLAGQQNNYLVKQLQAFKNGERNDPIMEPQAASLSDEDIENISAYYSSLK